MRRRGHWKSLLFCLACVGAMLLCASAWADGPATQPAAEAAATQPSETVTALLKQLDDPDFGVREFAEAKLSDMGPSIEPDLKGALNPGLSDEARARISHLIRQFDQARAMHASITMHYTKAPALTVLTDFATQAGATMGTDEPGVAAAVQGKLVSVDLDNASFWEGLKAVCAATNLTPSVGQNGVTLGGVPGRMMSEIDMSKPWICCRGGLLIEYAGSQLTRVKNFMGGPSFSSITIQINAIPEPRMHVIGTSPGSWIKQCIDDKGNSLVQDGLNRRGFVMPRMFPQRGPRLWQILLPASFREFPGIGTKVSQLKGELNLSIQTQGLVSEIPDITRAANTSKDDGELSVTVLACARTNMNYELTLLVRGAVLNDPGYQEFVNSVDLVDEKGESIPRQTYVPRPMPDGIRVTMGFLPTQFTPSKLRWERTIEQKHVNVPFEMNDLPAW